MTVQAMDFLPKRVQKAITEFFFACPGREEYLEEIRVRKNLPLCLVLQNTDVLLDMVASSDDIERTLALVTDCSYYSLENEFAQGYITVPGGHRVGLAGRLAYWDGSEVKLRDISGFNFRLARQVKGPAEKILPYIVNDDGRLMSTLVISPPRCGKTTLLRDICRCASEGSPAGKVRPMQVGIVDERSEIAACFGGVPQYDLGPRVDVLDRCPKAKGMMLLLRAMGPDVIVTDEIGGEEDAKAVASVLSGGAAVLASCHGTGMEDIGKKPLTSWLLSKGFFDKLIILSRRKGPGTVEYVGAI
jgi:stage III sporulation protein AA